MKSEDVLADSAYRVDDQGFTKIEERKQEYLWLKEELLEPVQSFDQVLDQETMEAEIEP